MDSSRMPPYSEEAEAGLLGSILLEHEKVLDICVDKKIRVDDFYTPAMRLIFETMGSMFAKHVSVDSLTLGDQLKRDKNLEKVGGAIFLDKLIDRTPTAAHAAHYIDIIQHKSKTRQIIQQCREGEHEAYECEDPEDLRSKLESKFTLMDGRQDIKGIGEIVQDIERDIELGAEGKPVERYIPTGYECIDQVSDGGMRNGVYWLTGFEQAGKTSLKANIIDRVLRSGKRVADLTIEMDLRDEIERLMMIHMDMNITPVMEGVSSMNAGKCADYKSLYVESGRFFIADQQTARTDIEFWSWCRRMVYRNKVDLIVLDPFYRLKVSGGERMTLEQETTSLSRTLTDIATSLKVALLVVAAVNDKGQIRGSRMADYDGAANWQLTRGDTEPTPPHYEDEVFFYTKKSRYGIPFATRKFRFYGSTRRFEEPHDTRHPELGLDGNKDD